MDQQQILPEGDSLLAPGRTKYKKTLIAGSVVIGVLCLCLALALVFFFAFHSQDDSDLDYFDEEKLTNWEKYLVDEISSCQIRCGLYSLTDIAHIAGTREDETITEVLESSWELAGLAVERDSYSVLLSSPVLENRFVTLLEDPDMNYNSFSCSLEEEQFSQDPYSEAPSRPPTFLAYSWSGSVEGQLIYVNYGREEDFAVLDALGVSVEGKIVLVRYAKVFRGNKVQSAEKRGAIGVLIYSDPIDDGSGRGVVYPDGPWRPGLGVQRGSVYTGSGDPQTPGYPSGLESPRLSSEEMHNATGNPQHLSNIPALPISYDDATPLLNALSFSSNCDQTPDEWQGGLNLKYCVGPGSATVQMGSVMEENPSSIVNLIAKIEGTEEKDRIVLIGNHRDAWTFGGSDPNSATAIMAELGRVLGKMLAKGWKPKRSIWLCSWDAEEFMLIGSTEFVERNEQLLMSSAVTYLNIDLTNGGPLLMLEGTPSLSSYYRSVTSLLPSPASSRFCSRMSSQSKKTCCFCDDVEYNPNLTCPSPVFDSINNLCLDSPPDPMPTNPFINNSLAENATTLLDHWNLEMSFQNQTLENMTMPGMTGNTGAGSDHTAFISHAGISVANTRFLDTENRRAGIYHSNYDNFRWMEMFGDPGYQYFRALGQLMGVIAIRTATLPVLHFTYTDYATLLEQSVASMNETYNGVQELNFLSLVTACNEMKESAQVLDQTRLRVIDLIKHKDSCPNSLNVRALNDKLMLVERSMLFLQRTDSRAWHRNVAWQSSEKNSYSTKAFSYISDVLEAGDFVEGQFRIQLTATYVNQVASNMRFTIC